MSGREISQFDTDWPHAPMHRLSESGTFMVTAGTYRKQPLFDKDSKLGLLQRALLTLAREHEWQLEAWAVFSNHYHFIAHSPEDASTLKGFIRELHSRTSIALNRHDKQSGRKVWHDYWETRLTHEESYLARLNYVHQNPVKHGLVPVASQYRYCSAGWFERTATSGQVKTIYRFKTDQVKVNDDY